jgi:hypothetical protein
MFSLCAGDPLLQQFTVDCFSYPSALFHLPWMSRFSNLQELARGLKTELETNYADYEEVTLVGHSLGAVVVRQYMVSELKAGRSPLAHRILLYAAPNTGSALAKIGTSASWEHRHLKQICKNSDVLDILNGDWVIQQVDAKCAVRWVVGGADGIVTPDSGSPFIGQDNVSTIVGRDHTAIVQPENADDIRYKVLQKFVLEGRGVQPRRHMVGGLAARPADPLFDVMNPQDEIFYLPRPLDAILKQIMPAGHVWVSGASGVGKTTSLRSYAFSSGWELHQIMLSGYRGRSADGLLRALSSEIGDLSGNGDIIAAPAATDIGELIGHIRRDLRTLCGEGVATVLVEEIPLAPGHELTQFVALLLQLALAIASDSTLDGRIQLAFSSIGELTLDPPDGFGKLKERIQFVKLPAWNSKELRRLIDMLCSILRPDLSEGDRQSITVAANGSPRFVKMVFRRWRNGTAEGLSLNDLIRSVQAEIV